MKAYKLTMLIIVAACYIVAVLCGQDASYLGFQVAMSDDDED